jgi:hypothetical protein
MSEPFDPYRKWLGIPPRDQPPHHYRLLGIAAFEDDPDVIENAAARQMRHLRTFQSSKHAVQSQRLLSEIASAKLCLLDAAQKAAYDQQLRAVLAAAGKLSSSQLLAAPVEEAEAVAEPQLPAPRLGSRWREEGAIEPVMPPPPVPIPMPPPMGTAVLSAPPLGAGVLAADELPAPIGVAVGVPVIRRSASSLARARRKQSSLPIVITVLSLLALAGAGALAIVISMNLGDSPGTTAPQLKPPKTAPSVDKPKTSPPSKQQPGEPAADDAQSNKHGTPFPIGTAILPEAEPAPPQP